MDPFKGTPVDPFQGTLKTLAFNEPEVVEDVRVTSLRLEKLDPRTRF